MIKYNPATLFKDDDYYCIRSKNRKTYIRRFKEEDGTITYGLIFYKCWEKGTDFSDFPKNWKIIKNRITRVELAISEETFRDIIYYSETFIELMDLKYKN